MNTTKVSVTIDVENPQTPLYYKKFSDNRIWSEGWGIEKIIEVLDQADVKGDFFTNIYEYVVWGRSQMERVVKTIHDAGHYVHLHTHPIWIDEKRRENMFQFDLQEQEKIIAWGSQFIYSCIGERPACHRAGAYGFDLNTLKACIENNIFVDSSYFHEHPNCHCQFPENLTVEYNGLTEMPVTFIRDEYGKIVKSDIDCMSMVQLDKFLDMVSKHDHINFINLFMHSYSMTQTKNYYENYFPNPDKVKKLYVILEKLKYDSKYVFKPLSAR